MPQWFKRQPAKKVRTAYNYRPNSSLSEQEKNANRHLLLSLLVIVSVAGGLYLWGIDIVVGISDLWRNFLPNTEIFEASQTPSEEQGLVFAPRLDPLPLFTNQPKIDIKGWAQPGAEAVIYLNNAELAALLTDKSGRFEYGSADLQMGANRIYAEIKVSKVVSEPSETQVVELDTTKPELSAEVHVDEVSDEGVVSITGTVELNTDLLINDRRVILSHDGSFTHELQLQPGISPIVMVAIDRAGNEAKIEQNVEYQKPEEEATTEETGEQSLQ